MGSADDFQAASLAMANAIGAHELDLREWLVLDLIRRLSYGAARCEAYIPSLNHFTVATRISKGNISQILGRLKRCLVIEERPQFFYGFLHPVANWKLSQRVEQIEVIRQLDLLEAPAHLSGAMRETFVEQSTSNQTQPPDPARGGELTIPIRGPCKPRKEASSSADASYAGVPESGTFFGGAVSESGTGSAHEGVGGALQQCKNALKEHCYIVNNKFDPVPTVPESGTGRGSDSQAWSGRFDEERQGLFDELERLGAFAATDPTGKVDKAASRGCWFGMVRDRPEVVRELIGELKYRLQQGRTVSNAGAFMMFTWKKWGRPNRR